MARVASLLPSAAALLLLTASTLVAQGTLPAEAPPGAPASGDRPVAADGAAPPESIPGLGNPARGWVIDDANLLSAGEIQALDVRLADHEAATSNQVVVLTVPSLQGQEIEEFSVAEANRRGIGQKGRDNGVLFVIAPNERAARIEVGYGLEGVLPDARAGRILRVDVVPRFREGNYGEGIEAGVGAILATLDGSYRPTLADRLPFQGLLGWFDSLPDMGRFDQAFVGIFLFIFGPILCCLPFAWLKWKHLGGWVGLALFAAVAFLLIRRYPWMPGGLGLIAGLLGYAWLDKRLGGRLSRGSRSGRGGSGGSGRGGSRSSWSSSSSSSRSFSGGGGSFGGGGASSRW